VVVCVPGGAESACTRFAVGALAPIEGAGDLGLAARVGCSPTSVGSTEADAGGSCLSGCVEPLVASRGVGVLLGQAGDVAGLAPPACRPPLDVPEYEARAASTRLVRRSFDRSLGEGEPTLGVPEDVYIGISEAEPARTPGFSSDGAGGEQRVPSRQDAAFPEVNGVLSSGGHGVLEHAGRVL
jgi:hypothetical protein